MRRLLIALIVLWLAAPNLSRVSAQTKAVEGDPPVLALITVSAPDDEGVVTLSGAAGATYPGAHMAIRNLYTDAVTYADATSSGAFTAKLYGPGNTPFWISPAKAAIPPEQRGQPGSLPGGPGTIIYGPFPGLLPSTQSVTPLVVDGDLSDWSGIPRSTVADGITVMRNSESLYLGVGMVPSTALAVQVALTVNATSYELTYTRQTPLRAALRSVSPVDKNLGTIQVASAEKDGAIELRIPMSVFARNIDMVTLNAVRALGDGAVVLKEIKIDAPVSPTDQIDGIARPNNAMPNDAARFTIGGAVAQGAGTWTAFARIDRLNVTDRLRPVLLQMDVSLNAPALPRETDDLTLSGQITLQPVTITRDGGTFPVSGLAANNGWSSVQTASGLAIDNLRAEVPLGSALTDAPQILRRDDALIFGLDFALAIPADLPPGLYVPIFTGSVEQGGKTTLWTDNGLLGQGAGISRLPLTRLPVLLNLGAAGEDRLLMTLFEDSPSAGSRGVLAQEDQPYAALSGRVRYPAPTYILPAHRADGAVAQYPLEPYLPLLLPGAADTTAPPLVPLLLPNGRLTALVTRPDGTTDDLGSAPFVQNQLSTPTQDERTLFGSGSPVDTYRLTTLSPRFGSYSFDQYGEYSIRLTGSVEDVWGNRYTGGGTYQVLVAEPLTMTTGVLPGTPFEVGDVFNPTLHLTPAVAADVTMTVRVYPLDGSAAQEKVIQGTASRFGYFASADTLRFTSAGEYTVDYEVRYTDSSNRLWAGSQRGAGVIASPDRALIGHGARALADIDPDLRPAWYNGRVYAQIVGADSDAIRPNAPFFSGDVTWIADSATGGVQPAVRVQDTVGKYSDWLQRHLTPGVAIKDADELPVPLMGPTDSAYGIALLPGRIVNDAYTYFSAVRPGVTERQFVLGADDGGLPLGLNGNDPANGQVGAGAGNLPGDYLFLFGGAIIRNPQADVREAVIYSSLAVVIPDDDPIGPRVYPPFRGEAGGADGGPLLLIDNQPSEIFFHPTAIQPGQILNVGDLFSLAGQVAPTLPSTVSVRVTAPSGKVRQFSGAASAIGYYNDPANDFQVDEVGIWSVDLQVTHHGLTSVGVIEPPAPTGGIPGAPSGHFSIYVVPPDSEILATSLTDVTFPPALPYNFIFSVPSGWTNVQVAHTLTMPGFLVEDGPVNVTGSSFSYQYNPTNLNKRFPNYELAGDISGPAAADPLTLTFMVTGTDAEGRGQLRSRVFSILHDRILSFDQDK